MPYAKPEHVKAMRNRRYMERREALVERLGGCCADCGADDVPLEFDHLTERRWSNRSVGGLQRIRNYEREAARGEIALRCALCHDVRHGFVSHEEAEQRRAMNVERRQLAFAGSDPQDADEIDANRPF